MITKWKVLEREVIKHVNKCGFSRSIEDVTFELPDGKQQTFSLKKEGCVVAILALDEKGDVILTRQFRPGPEEVLDEVPGGGVEKGEDPLTAAKRELLEETGYESENWKYLCQPLECAYSNIERHAYVAIDCKKTSDQNLDDTEFIEVIIKTKDDFIHQLVNGKLSDPEVGWHGLYEIGYLKR